MRSTSYRNHRLLHLGIFVCAYFIDGAHSGSQHISETLSKAICKINRAFSESQSTQPPLKSLTDHPELTKTPSCIHFRKCTSGCQGFSSVACSTFNGGDDDDGDSGVSVRRMSKVKDSGKKMLGGDLVDSQEVPYLVNIRWEPIQQGRSRAKCSGTVLNEFWILTSSLCSIIPMRRRNGEPTHAVGVVTFGEQYFDETKIECKREDTWEEQVSYLITSVEVPTEAFMDLEKGTLSDSRYDIGLLKVDKPIHVMPITLAREEKHCVVQPRGESRLIGWGRGSKGAVRSPYNIAKIYVLPHVYGLKVDKMDDNTCMNALVGQTVYDLTYTFCGKVDKSRNADSSTCSSDCGGPMIVTNVEDEFQAPVPVQQVFQCGIISQPSCESGKLSTRPEVIARVLPHIEWIKSVAGSILDPK